MLMLVDMSPIIKRLRDNEHLRTAALHTSPHYIIEGLLEEPMGPRECPLVFPYIQQVLEEAPPVSPVVLGRDYFVQPVIDADFLAELEIELEKLQLYMDMYLQSFHEEMTQGQTIEAELIKWLGAYQALIAVRVDGASRYDV
jgi:hypothetical protein